MSVISRDPEICGGAPRFAGTRVPVRIFFECLEAGYTVNLFVDHYPTVSKEQALALLDETRGLYEQGKGNAKNAAA